MTNNILSSLVQLREPLENRLRTAKSSNLSATSAQPQREHESGARVAREWLKYIATLLLIFTLGVGQVWGGEYVYDFSSNANWYTASSGTTHPTNGTDYTSFYDNRSPRVQWTLSSSNDRSRFNSGYFILGKTGKYINLPTYANEKITSVVVHNSSGCSTSAAAKISTTGGTEASASQSWNTQNKNYTYNIGTDYQSSSLRLVLTADYRAQITSITINTASAASCSATPTIGTASLNGPFFLSRFYVYLFSLCQGSFQSIF